ncbi:MAG: peptidylprolyl isomerase [Planctomycetota bacterium]|nr:peptidylprolyl isomerase [Planctomycetota bacterium]MDA1177332.1 peptidylprolyl isomerase [Planctomycetota bacterium]
MRDSLDQGGYVNVTVGRAGNPTASCWLQCAAWLTVISILTQNPAAYGQAKTVKSQSEKSATSKSLTKKRTTKKGSSAAEKKKIAAASKTSAENLAARPVARVNDQIITWQELAQQCLERHGVEVLESLVNKHLILEECGRRGVTITQQQVDDEIVAIAGKFKLSVENWIDMLQKERNISLTQYRNEIVWPTLALRELSQDRIQVDEREIDLAFESEYGVKVQVSMIMANSKKSAEAILKEVRANPDDFGRIAKDKSEDKHSAAARGLLPPIRKNAGDPDLERTAFAMQPNEISDVLKLNDKYIILKCERHIPAAHIAPQFEAEARKRLTDRIQENNLRSVASELFEKLQSDANIVNIWNQPELRQKMPQAAATVNGKSIPVEQLRQACFDRYAADVLDDEINYRVLNQALAQQGQRVTREDLDGEVDRAAESYGYLLPDGKPDRNRWLKEIESSEGMTVELYMKDAVWPSVALKKLVASSVKVSAEDFKKGFEANYGERVEALAIVLSNQRTAQEVWKMARDNPSQTYFGELANQYSTEQVSRANFGGIPPIGRHGGQPLVESEAFKLKAGELSGIVATGDKFVILRCLGRTAPVVGDAEKEAVRDELTKAIQEKKLRIAMAEEFDRLKAEAKVQNLIANLPGRADVSARVPAVPVSQSNK